MGFLRGECQAIKNGYGSRELFILGEVAGLEAGAKKNQIYMEEELAKEKGTHEKKLSEIKADQKLQKEEKERKIAEEIESYQKKFDEQKAELDKLNAYIGNLKEFKDSVWEKKVNSPEEAQAVKDGLKKFLKKTEDMKKYQGMHYLYEDTFHIQERELEETVAAKDYQVDLPELTDFAHALDRFNTKRTGIRMSDESKIHKAVREKAEDLQKDLTLLQAGRNADGAALSMEEKQKLLTGVMKKAEEMEQAADHYLSERKGKRREAGNERKAGAEDLKRAMSQMKGVLSRQLELANEALGINPQLENEIKEAMEYSAAPEKNAGQEQKSPGDRFHDRMAKDLKRFRGMSENEFHGPAKDMPGMNEWEYQFGLVLAEQMVDMAVGKGKIPAAQAERQVVRAFNDIIKRPGFKEMVKDTCEDLEKQRKIAGKKPGEMLASVFQAEKQLKAKQAEEKRPQRRQAQRVKQAEDRKLQAPG